ncbi:MAG: phosphodiester glycosidase family protein [Clostridia bacterium]|nr:phosphodiester glycosidase family protein [Clostridia bacterium]
MKKLSTRAIAWILLILLALSCVIPAFAADEDARTVQTVLGDGLTLTRLNSYLGGVRRQQFTLDYEPGGTVQPLVLYGDTLYGKSTVTQVVEYARGQGYHVLAAVNSDFFFTGSGIPTGMTVQDGVLVTSDGSWNAVGFFEDGTAMAGTPGLKLTLVTEDGTEYPIYALNNVRTKEGLYLYTTDFDTATRTTAAGTEAVLDIIGRREELRIGSSVEATVRSVSQTKNTPVEEGTLVLSLTADNKAGLDLLTMLEEGQEVTVCAETADDRWEDVVWATGGGNMLVRDGELTADANVTGREPRTLLGIREDGSCAVIQCDGRQTGLSSGLTLTEGARLLLDMDCVDVINLDGGGSSVTAVAYPGLEPEVLSSPSDGAPRAGATYLLFVATGDDGGRSYGSVVYPRSATVLTGAVLPVSAVSYNRDYLGFLDVTDRLESTDGWVEDGLFYAPDYAADCLLETDDSRCQSAVITVTDRIASLNLGQKGKALSALTLDRGQTAQLEVLASDGLRPILCTPDQFTFSVSGSIGTVDEAGLFTAGSKVGEGAVTVSWGDTSCTLPVTVAGKPSVLLEGFENGTDCGTFGSAQSSASITTDLTQVAYGRAALSLTYGGGAGDMAEYLFTDPVALSGPSHLTVTAKGSGNWSWLFRLEDGSVTALPMALSGSGWQVTAAALPQNAQSLLGFTCEGAGSHTLLLDRITGHFGGVTADRTPPVIDLTLTEAGGLSAAITDSGETPVAKADITLLVDGTDTAFTFSGGRLTASLPDDGALHRVTLTVRDNAGNLARASLDVGALTPSFADMNGHWAASHAEYLLQKGVFSPSAAFNPGTKVSNEMAATMLSRYLGVDTALYEDVVLPYTDVRKIASWALPHVKAMYALGVMKGSTDSAGRSVLRPQDSCTRAQIMTVLGRTLDRGYVYEACDFTDSGKIPAWARDHIDLLSGLGIVTGGADGKVNPLGTITRAEFAALLYRLY